MKDILEKVMGGAPRGLASEFGKEEKDLAQKGTEQSEGKIGEGSSDVSTSGSSHKEK